MKINISFEMTTEESTSLFSMLAQLSADSNKHSIDFLSSVAKEAAAQVVADALKQAAEKQATEKPADKKDKGYKEV